MENRLKIISGSILKTVACITMLIDHIGAAGLIADNNVYWIFRTIGRTAFPIFCFLMGEGLQYSRNKWKYLLRLFLFAIIAEAPFDLMNGQLDRYAFEYQNVIFTLLFGYIASAVITYIKSKADALAKGGAARSEEGKSPVTFRKVLVYAGFAVIAASVSYIIYKLAWTFNTDYGGTGVLVVLFFCLLRGKWKYYAMLLAFFVLGYENPFELWAFPGFILMLLYNGERGFIKTKPLQIGYYFFYPVHLLILGLIAKYIYTPGAIFF